VSETRAKSVKVYDMKCLERLVLPRRCTLSSGSGLPALRSMVFGACDDGLFGWNPRQVRFESLLNRGSMDRSPGARAPSGRSRASWAASRFRSRRDRRRLLSGWLNDSLRGPPGRRAACVM
jgi:hypothetical protein